MLLLPLLAASIAAAAVPTPAETPVEVVVSGRTCTLKSIRIVPTGQEIPPNFSGGQVKNTPGYSWYVSRHFAMKTDMPEKWAQDCLTWAELAYPQAVWVMGREPEGLDTRRMVFAYGKNLDSMREATFTDGGFRWAYSGGGVTFDFLKAAYDYPSGSLTYHKRDLVIHENLHLLQAVLTGTCYNTPMRFLEGVTYAFANHVYDSNRKQLTVRVLDKPTVNNICDAGLSELDHKFLTIRELMDDKGDGPVWGLYTQFMWTDPDRLMKWRLWRDELFRLGGRDLKANDERLMKEIYGDLGALEAQWRAWVTHRRSSFHYIDWGWEQEGLTMWSYGWPQKTAFSQTDVNLPLGERAASDPLRMDYPGQGVPAYLVGPVHRGPEGPTVGAILDFSRNPDQGLCGLALGVMEGQGGSAGDRPAAKPARPAGKAKTDPAGPLEQLNIYFQAGKTLVIDGTALGLKKAEADVPAEFRSAMKADAFRAGLTVHVAAAALEVTLRAGPAATVKAFALALPLTPAARSRVLTCPSAIIAKEGYHGVTPLFDAPRRVEENLAKPSPANRWHFTGDADLYRLYRAAWRLGKATPPSLLALRHRLTDAMDKDEDTQCGATAAYAQQFRQVVKDVRGVADEAAAQAATAELIGVSMELRVADDGDGTGPAGAAGPVGPAAAGRPRIVARIRGPVEGQATATVTFQAPQGPSAAPAELKLDAGKPADAAWIAPPPAGAAGPAEDVQTFSLQARADVQWEGMKLSLTDSKTLWPSVPRWWVVGPFDNKGDATVDTPQPPEKGPIDLKAGYPGKGGRTVQWQRCQRPADLPAGQENVLDFEKLLGGPADNASVYALTFVESPADAEAVLSLGSDDGVVAWVNGLRVHAKLASRGYRSMEDAVPIRLHKGRNELLVKVTQTTGGWKLCAHLLDKAGQPLPGVTYTLGK